MCGSGGRVYPTAQLEELAAVVREHPRMLVIADEIYEKIVFEGCASPHGTP